MPIGTHIGDLKVFVRAQTRTALGFDALTGRWLALFGPLPSNASRMLAQSPYDAPTKGGAVRHPVVDWSALAGLNDSKLPHG